MSNQIPNPTNKKKYDLAERTAKFGEEIIEFCQSLSDNPSKRDKCRRFWQEAHEFVLIFFDSKQKKEIILDLSFGL
jgi:hypothetical protein